LSGCSDEEASYHYRGARSGNSRRSNGTNVHWRADHPKRTPPETNPGSSLWCDALFTGKEYGVTKLDAEKRVRATCVEGDRCQVKGTVEGHGVFYWTKITSVKKL
jgi:hypothetical protein